MVPVRPPRRKVDHGELSGEISDDEGRNDIQRIDVSVAKKAWLHILKRGVIYVPRGLLFEQLRTVSPAGFGVELQRT